MNKPGIMHVLCPKCYFQEQLQGGMREPIEVAFPQCLAEPCCFCGEYAHAAVYYRAPVGRKTFCMCDEGTVHPRSKDLMSDGHWRKQGTERHAIGWRYRFDGTEHDIVDSAGDVVGGPSLDE